MLSLPVHKLTLVGVQENKLLGIHYHVCISQLIDSISGKNNRLSSLPPSSLDGSRPSCFPSLGKEIDM